MNNQLKFQALLYKYIISFINSPFTIVAISFVLIVMPLLVGGKTLMLNNVPGILPTGSFSQSTSQPVLGLFAIDPLGTMNGEVAQNAFAKDSISHNQFPLWNPYQGLGKPFHIDSAISTLSPLTLIRQYIPVKNWDAVYLLVLFSCGFFTALFAREIGMTLLGAGVAGTATFTSGFVTLYTTNVILAGYAWLPLILYSIERIAKEPSSRINIFIATIAIYGLATCGHPTPQIYSAVTIVVFLVFRLRLVHYRRAFLAATAISTFLALLISAPQWLPFVLFIPEAMGSLEYGQQQWSIINTIPTFFLPYAYSTVHSTLILNKPTNLMDYWSMGYFPPFVGFLSIAGGWGIIRCRELFLKPERCAFYALLISSFILLLFVYDSKMFSVFKSIKAINRININYMWFIPSFFMCLIAGKGSELLLEAGGTFRKNATYIWAILVVTCVAIMMNLLRLNDALSALAISYRLVLLADIWWAIIGAITIIIIADNSTKNKESVYWLIVFIGLILSGIAYFPIGGNNTLIHIKVISIEIFTIIAAIAWIYNNKISNSGLLRGVLIFTGLVAVGYSGYYLSKHDTLPNRQNPFNKPPYVNWLESHTRNGERIYSTELYLMPNFSSFFHISSINNLSTLLTTSEFQFLKRFISESQNPHQIWGAQNASEGNTINEYWRNQKYFRLLGVKYLITTSDPNYINFDGVEFPGQLPLGISKSYIKQKLEYSKSQLVDGPPKALKYPITFPYQCKGISDKGISFNVWNFGKPVPGKFIFGFLNLNSNAIQHNEFDALNERDGEAQKFLFSNVCDSGNETYKVSLKFIPKKIGAPNNIAVVFTSTHQFIYNKISPVPSPLINVFYDKLTGASVWEDKQAGGRTYVASTVVHASDWTDSQNKFSQLEDPHKIAIVEDSSPSCDIRTVNYLNIENPNSSSLVTFSPNSANIDIQVTKPGILVLTDAYAPGWRATINGKEAPVFRVDGVFRGVCIEKPGHQIVTFSYSPPFWKIAIALCALGLIFFFTVLVVGVSNLPFIRKAE